MRLIGENIHIISDFVRNALVNRDETFVNNLIDLQANMDCVDLNVGPAKGDLAGILAWLCQAVEKRNPKLTISFDTTNAEEMRKGFEVCNNPSAAFINSTSKDEPRFSAMTALAAEYNCNLIALTMGKETGIPKSADGRLEIAFEIYENCLEQGIESEKLFFDPLILPVTVDQSQGLEALHTIKMIKESFDPPVKTVIGLSNISNGAPKELRPLINRVYAVLAFGAGLDAAIVDAKDLELVRILNMLKSSKPVGGTDELYINLANMIADFGEFEDVKFNENSTEEQIVMKTAAILLNKKIYSNSFTQI